jgi:hypothetical protein
MRRPVFEDLDLLFRFGVLDKVFASVLERVYLILNFYLVRFDLNVILVEELGGEIISTFLLRWGFTYLRIRFS